MDAPIFPPAPRFDAMLRPTSDFQAVRDGRSTGPLYIDIDLSTARSVAAGTALELTIAGNSFYIDQRPNTGLATAYFESDDRGFTPISIFAGFKARVPFTRIYLENVAQPRAILRIVYGVDIDLEPGTGAGVSILNPITIEDALSTNGQHYYFTGANPVGNNLQLAIDVNNFPRGVRIRNVYLAGAAGAGGTITLALFASDQNWAGSFVSSNQAIAFACLSNWQTTVQQLNVPMRLRIPFNSVTMAGGQPMQRVWLMYSAATAAGSVECAIDYEGL